MRMSSSQLAILFILLLVVQACRIRITPLPPPADPPKTETICQAAPIEKNIIGNWRAGSRQSILNDTIPKATSLTSTAFSRIGKLTFKSDFQLVDPDSLFENYIDQWGPVMYKTYSVETDSILFPTEGRMFWVKQYAKNRRGITGLAQRYYFKIISNECNRIHLKGPHGALEIVLFRL